ncbi:MAG: nucleoside deaminase [Bacteroidota bacterium]|nr:nucleoside deaminase [Bacteroidota bacterium]
MIVDHESFMRQALVQAQRAFDVDEVPVGAVVVMHGKIIAKAYNQVQLLKDVTAHAEILAITSACEQLQEKYLTEATLYVTVEPCLMCAGALYWNKIGHIVFGASDEKNSYRRVTEKNPFHPSTTITGGILAAECSSLMTSFFKAKR